MKVRGRDPELQQIPVARLLLDVLDEVEERRLVAQDVLQNDAAARQDVYLVFAEVVAVQERFEVLLLQRVEQERLHLLETIRVQDLLAVADVLDDFLPVRLRAFDRLRRFQRDVFLEYPQSVVHELLVADLALGLG